VIVSCRLHSARIFCFFSQSPPPSTLYTHSFKSRIIPRNGLIRILLDSNSSTVAHPCHLISQHLSTRVLRPSSSPSPGAWSVTSRQSRSKLVCVMMIGCYENRCSTARSRLTGETERLAAKSALGMRARSKSDDRLGLQRLHGPLFVVLFTLGARARARLRACDCAHAV